MELDRQNEAIWKVIDEIAAGRGLSASRLAIQSDLDSTAFNKSKRVRDNGQRRWPTMEVIAKVLLTAQMSYAEFGALVDEKRGAAR